MNHFDTSIFQKLFKKIKIAKRDFRNIRPANMCVPVKTFFCAH